MVGLDLSAQAWTFGITNMLVVILAFFVVLFAKRMSAFVFLYFIFVSASVALYVYDTNCLTTGRCNTWSWIRTIANIIVPISVIIIVIFNPSILKTNSL